MRGSRLILQGTVSVVRCRLVIAGSQFLPVAFFFPFVTFVTAVLVGLSAILSIPGSDWPSRGPPVPEAEALRVCLGATAGPAYLDTTSDRGRAHPDAPGRERGCVDFGVAASLSAALSGRGGSSAAAACPWWCHVGGGEGAAGDCGPMLAPWSRAP